MIEKHIVLEDIDPVIFYGPNTSAALKSIGSSSP